MSGGRCDVCSVKLVYVSLKVCSECETAFRLSERHDLAIAQIEKQRNTAMVLKNRYLEERNSALARISALEAENNDRGDECALKANRIAELEAALEDICRGIKPGWDESADIAREALVRK